MFQLDSRQFRTSDVGQERCAGSPRAQAKNQGSRASHAHSIVLAGIRRVHPKATSMLTAAAPPLLVRRSSEERRPELARWRKLPFDCVFWNTASCAQIFFARRCHCIAVPKRSGSAEFGCEATALTMAARFGQSRATKRSFLSARLVSLSKSVLPKKEGRAGFIRQQCLGESRKRGGHRNFVRGWRCGIRL